MKNSILVAFVAMLIPTLAAAQSEKKAIEQTIIQFAKAGDDNDVSKLENLLHEAYHVNMNQLFGSKYLTVVSRTFYLEKIASKEWGGDHRKVTIESTVVSGKNAFVKATLEGSKSTFISLFILVQNAEGKWLLMSDTPTVI